MAAYELLGFFYDLNKTNIEDNLNLILDTLVSMTSFNFERPKADGKKLSAVEEIMDAFPAKYRIVVEHTMAQLNKFQILAQKFRHQLTKHSVIFRIVCCLVYRRILLRPSKQYRPA